MPLADDSCLAEMPASGTRARTPSIPDLMSPITKGMEALDDFVKARPEFSVAVKCGVASVHRAACALFHDVRGEYAKILRRDKNERRRARREATKRAWNVTKERALATQSAVGITPAAEANAGGIDFYAIVRLGGSPAGLHPTPQAATGVLRGVGKRTRIRVKRQP